MYFDLSEKVVWCMRQVSCKWICNYLIMSNIYIYILECLELDIFIFKEQDFWAPGRAPGLGLLCWAGLGLA